MWHYEKDSQQFGPVSVDEIEQLFRSGAIDGSTPVWREGMSEWRALDETDLVVVIQDSLYISAVPPKLPVFPPPLNSTGSLVKLSAVKSLFSWCIGSISAAFVFLIGFVEILIYVIQFYKQVTSISTIVIAFSAAAMAFLWFGCLAAFGVLTYVLLYKFWQIVQDGFASTTPGAAIGFIFIPYFNFYWIFRALYGLAKDLNRYIERHFPQKNLGEVRKAHPFISLTNILFSFGICIVYLFYYFLVFFPMIESQKINSIAPETLFISIFGTMGIIFAILFFLNLLMFIDFYLTAKSILKAEGQA